MTTTKPVPGTETQIALGRTFLRERSRTGVTLERIATALKTSINTIRWHEAGARSLRADDLIAAAGVMGCSPATLIAVEEAKQQANEKKPRRRKVNDNPA